MPSTANDVSCIDVSTNSRCRQRRSRKSSASGWVIVVVVVLCLTLGFIGRNAKKPTEKPHLVDASDGWYKGGNLHKRSLLDWKRADNRNRLATAADIATVAMDGTTLENLRERAKRFEDWLTTMATHPDLDDETLSGMKVSSVASSLGILLTEDSLYDGTLLDWKSATIPERMKTLVAWGHVKFPGASRGEVLELADFLTLHLDYMVELLDSNAALEKESVSHHLEQEYKLSLPKSNDVPENPILTTESTQPEEMAIAQLQRIGAIIQRTESGAIVKVNLRGTAIDDEGLELLTQLQNLTGLDLKKCRNVTNDGLKHLAGIRRLAGLDLSFTGIGDSGIEQLGESAELHTLSLWETNVTSDGLRHLYRLRNLKNMYLPRRTSQVSVESVQALQRNLPNCKVYR